MPDAHNRPRYPRAQENGYEVGSAQSIALKEALQIQKEELALARRKLEVREGGREGGRGTQGRGEAGSGARRDGDSYG